MSESAPAHLRLGKAGEDFAAVFLQKAGYAILARNWRRGHLELDIVCEKEKEIFFVEVKTRRDNRRDRGIGAITADKRKRLICAAQMWLSFNGRWQAGCHFDVICLFPRGHSFQIEYYKDAFDCSPSLDSGNAYWQP